MKTAMDVVKGKIVDIDEHGVVTIKCLYTDWFTLIKREYKECNIQMIDSRPLSDKQRRACYALIGEIADYVGEGKDRTKEYMKLKFLAEDFGETADKIFSLSNAPMSLVCAFQKYLVSFILQWVCGSRAELHHVDRVGMGRNREEIIHEGMEAMPLCREHHTECHTMGQREFDEKYHLEGGILLDRTLCKIYGLKKKKPETEDEINERNS